jgi:hypothetical protein
MERMEGQMETTNTKTFTVTLDARSRDINARCSNGGDTYTMILMPEATSAVWADSITGCEIITDNYPRSRGIRASERRGSMTVKLALPEGAIKIEIFKPVSQRERTSKTAAILTTDGMWQDLVCTARKSASGSWETVIKMADGTERVCA